MKVNVMLWPTTELHLADVAINVNSMLLNQGYESSISNGFSDCLNIVIGAVACRRYPLKIPENSIIVNMEQLHDDSQWNTSWYRDLLSKMKVIDYNVHNQKWLQSRLNINVPIMTLGWCSSLLYCNEVEKDIDVLFYGGVNDRRVKFLQELVEYKLVVRNNNLFGDEKRQLIERSKIVINCHYYDVALFEWPRVQHLIINGAFVISEDSSNMEEYKSYCPIVITKFNDPSDMKRAVNFYLYESEERKRLAKECQEKLKKVNSIFPMSSLVLI